MEQIFFTYGALFAVSFLRFAPERYARLQSRLGLSFLTFNFFTCGYKCKNFCGELHKNRICFRKKSQATNSQSITDGGFDRLNHRVLNFPQLSGLGFLRLNSGTFFRCLLSTCTQKNLLRQAKMLLPRRSLHPLLTSFQFRR